MNIITGLRKNKKGDDEFIVREFPRRNIVEITHDMLYMVDSMPDIVSYLEGIADMMPKGDKLRNIAESMKLYQSKFRDYSYMYGSAQSRDEAIEAANIAHEYNLAAINGYFDRLESVSDE